MDHKILVFPDGTALGKSSFRKGDPVRSPRPRYARIFTTESERQTYRLRYPELGLRSATLRVEIIEGD